MFKPLTINIQQYLMNYEIKNSFTLHLFVIKYIYHFISFDYPYTRSYASDKMGKDGQTDLLIIYPLYICQVFEVYQTNHRRTLPKVFAQFVAQVYG